MSVININKCQAFDDVHEKMLNKIVSFDKNSEVVLSSPVDQASLSGNKTARDYKQARG